MKRFFLYGISKSFLFKLIIVLFILLIGKDVFAAEQNVSSKIKATVNYSSGTYYGGTPGSISVIPGFYNVNTRYEGTLSYIEFYLSSNDWNWNYNKTYTVTMNMATADWRNHFMGPNVFRTNSDGSVQSGYGNMYITNTFQYVSYYKIKFNIKTGSSMGMYTKFVIYSTNTNTTAFTGVSNWNLSSIIISDVSNAGGSGSTSGGSTSATPTPSPTPNNTQDIINNNNSNTQSIIDNDNENTSTIVENNNSNTQSIIDSNSENTQSIIDSNSCPVGPISLNEDYIEYENYKLASDGVATSSSSNAILPYLQIKAGETYTLTSTFDTNTYGCWYGRQKNVISCFALASGTRSVVAPDSSYFLRLTMSRRSGNWVAINLKGPICNDWEEYFTNKLRRDMTGGLSDVNDSINNSNVDSGTGSDFFNDFSSQDNGGISGIITKPLVLINSLLSNNSNCNNLSFGIKFPNMETKNVSLPSGCILWNNVPSNVVNIYQMFVVGFCSYYLLKRLFKDVEDLKNPEKDEVEVIDL